MSIESIRERAEAATPGPWKWDDDNRGVSELRYPATGTLAPDPSGVVHFGPVLGICGEWTDTRPEPADAAFIAHARQDIPALLKAVELASLSLGHAEHYECDFAWCQEFRDAIDAIEALT